MKDIRKVFNAIKENSDLCTSQVAKMLDLPLRRVENAIWELWSVGKIQIRHDSTLRCTRESEKVFRHFAP